MKTYGKKREWAESDMTNKSIGKKKRHGEGKKRTKFWKKRARQTNKKEIQIMLTKDSTE